MSQIRKLLTALWQWFRFKALLGDSHTVINLNEAVLMSTSVDWKLSIHERNILDHHMAKFVSLGEIVYEDISVHRDRHPNLHYLVAALQGRTAHGVCLAAYDWVLHEYPEIKQLTEKEE
jgi:hypothetical protein